VKAAAPSAWRRRRHRQRGEGGGTVSAVKAAAPSAWRRQRHCQRGEGGGTVSVAKAPSARRRRRHCQRGEGTVSAAKAAAPSARRRRQPRPSVSCQQSFLRFPAGHGAKPPAGASCSWPLVTSTRPCPGSLLLGLSALTAGPAQTQRRVAGIRSRVFPPLCLWNTTRAPVCKCEDDSDEVSFRLFSSRVALQVCKVCKDDFVCSPEHSALRAGCVPCPLLLLPGWPALLLVLQRGGSSADTDPPRSSQPFLGPC